MSTYVTEKPRFHIDWSCVQKAAKDGGKLVFAFAMGGWLVSIRAEEGQLPYRTKATAKFEQVQQVAGPNPVATIKCERTRADVAEAVADQAVAVSNFSVTPPKMLEAIPDCPPPPKVKHAAQLGAKAN